MSYCLRCGQAYRHPLVALRVPPLILRAPPDQSRRAHRKVPARRRLRVCREESGNCLELNRWKLTPHDPVFLHDGDVLAIGSFFCRKDDPAG